MREAVYVLCAATSLLCAVLLLRGYTRSGARLLLWSGLCFVGLCVNNVLLYIDKAMFPTVDLQIWRTLAAMAGISLMVFGLVWESE